MTHCPECGAQLHRQPSPRDGDWWVCPECGATFASLAGETCRVALAPGWLSSAARLALNLVTR